LNKTINREAISALEDVDLVVMMVEAMKWTDEDNFVLKRLENVKCPVFLLVNKVDRIKDKDQLLVFMQEVANKREFAEIFPVSASKGMNTDAFVDTMLPYLPEGEFIYPEDHITDKSIKFICSEFIREQIMQNLHQEIPYLTAVEIEKFEETAKLTTIHATIWVGRKNQKGIVIGNKGETLKRIGTAARHTLEDFLQQKVFLKLWVKVEDDWHNNPKHLKELGITE
jgi:GTP-binding protein Era